MANLTSVFPADIFDLWRDGDDIVWQPDGYEVRRLHVDRIFGWTPHNAGVLIESGGDTHLFGPGDVRDAVIERAR